jgi:predicted amino acid-binding ACT domain protein
MELSPEIIMDITRLVAEKLGAQASTDEVANVVQEAVARISGSSAIVSAWSADIPEIEDKQSRKLILNALGVLKGDLADKIRAFIAGKALRITDLTSTRIDTFFSLIAIIDYTDFKADLNQLKFELEKICSGAGYKAIIQDSEYYKTR